MNAKVNLLHESETVPGLIQYESIATDGSRAHFTNMGASVTALFAPDRNGQAADVVLGFATPEEYIHNSPALGATCGRYANRIAHGQFTIDGTQYKLAINHGEHHLHGGENGFGNQLFDAEACEEEGHPGVRFRLASYDGDEGYPGTLKLTVTYILKPGPELLIRYQAVTDQSTIINLTNHSYFNLAGHRAGTIADHVFHISADEMTTTDSLLIPDGYFSPVEGTPFDFRHPTSYLQHRTMPHPSIEKQNGYDTSYRLPSGRDISEPVCVVNHPASGRTLTTYTTQPSLHFYSAGSLDSVAGKDGAMYQPESGFCLETQHFPNSPNCPQFPSTVLRPGDMYHHETRYCFSVTE